MTISSPNDKRVRPLSMPTSLLSNPQEQFSLLSCCARALLRAYFDSANEDPQFIGARHLHLQNHLRQEHISSPKWKVYRQIWGEEKRGFLWDESNRGVTRFVVQTSTGGVTPERPSVFATLDQVLRDKIPPTLLIDWYRADLCAYYAMEDTPDFIIFANDWLDKFNLRIRAKGPMKDSISRMNLLQVSESTGASRHNQWIHGLIELLEFLGVLQFNKNSPDSYRIQFRADSASVITNLFGRSTGVEGLDTLFFGGLWVPGLRAGTNKPNTDNSDDNHDYIEPKSSADKLSLIISGSPGMGKSTLALALGLQVAARGGLCLLFRFELDQSTILRQIAQFYRRLMPYFYIRSPDGGDLHTPDPIPPNAGVVVISDIATSPFEQIEDTILESAAQLDNASFGERIIVFDSISAIEGYGVDPSLWRGLLFSMTSALRALGFTVVYIIERERGSDVGFEDYVADVDIRLIKHDSAGFAQSFPHSFRTIEVAKSRIQVCHRGIHVFAIQSDTGMKVYPSSAAIINVHRRREARIQYAETQAINPGIGQFAKYLSNSHNGDGINPEIESVPWWRVGSITALIGKRGTLKSSFGEAFSSTLDNDCETPSCALALHFGDEFPLSHTGFQREDHRPVSFGVRYDRSLNEFGSTLSYILFRSGYVTSGNVLNIVREIIEEKRKAQTPIRRAVISDTGNITPDFPSLRDDPVFIPALCDVLASEGITTLIIYSRAEHGDIDYVVDQIRSVAENIVKLDRVAYAGREYTSISVERTDNSTHDRGVYEIKKDWSSNGDVQLKIEPTFDLVLDVPKNPKAAKVKIMLHAETELQMQYHSSINRLHKGMGAYEVEVLGHAAAFAQYGVAQHVMASERALWVTQVDAYEINFTNDETTSCMQSFYNLASIEPSIRDDLRNILIDPPSRKRHGSDEINQTKPSICSIPYYLNPSFLVIRQEFHEFLTSQKKWKRIAEGEGKYSWRELLNAAAAFRKQATKSSGNQWENFKLFDCPLETAQNLNCLFFEIVESLLGRAGNGHCVLNQQDCLECFSQDSPLRRDKDHLVEAALVMRQLLKECLPEHPSNINQSISNQQQTLKSTEYRQNYAPDDVTSVLPYTKSNSIMWRHWYTTFRQMLADMSGDRTTNPGVVPMRLPGAVWTSGDWHLAILQGSVGVREGIKIIRDEFVTRTASVARMVQGIGLPPFKDFYRESGSAAKLPVSDVPPNWFLPYLDNERVIHRSLLGNYKLTSSLLNSYLESIVSIKAEDEAVLQQAIRERFDSLHDVIHGMWGGEI